MKKTGKCECGNTIFQRTITEDLKFVWECTSCHKRTPYRKSTAKKSQVFEDIPVTASQKKTILKLKKDIETNLPETHEIKTYHISPGVSSSDVYADIEIGKKDEKGTDIIFERFRRTIQISVRGDAEDSWNSVYGLSQIVEDITK